MLDKIFKSKEVAVIEMDKFYETEIGQKVLASAWYDESLKALVDHRGYAVKRGNNYFLVYYGKASTPINDNLTVDIKRRYIVYPIKENSRGNVSRDEIFSELTLKFDCKKNNYEVIFTPRTNTRIGRKGHRPGLTHPLRVETQVYVKPYVYTKDKNVFKKFIELDAHWFECFTHDATRQEVLNGTAGENVLEKKELEIWNLLWRREQGVNPTIKKIDNLIKKPKNFINEWRVIKERKDRIREY